MLQSPVSGPVGCLPEIIVHVGKIKFTQTEFFFSHVNSKFQFKNFYFYSHSHCAAEQALILNGITQIQHATRLAYLNITI